MLGFKELSWWLCNSPNAPKCHMRQSALLEAGLHLKSHLLAFWRCRWRSCYVSGNWWRWHKLARTVCVCACLYMSDTRFKRHMTRLADSGLRCWILGRQFVLLIRTGGFHNGNRYDVFLFDYKRFSFDLLFFFVLCAIGVRFSSRYLLSQLGFLYIIADFSFFIFTNHLPLPNVLYRGQGAL